MVAVPSNVAIALVVGETYTSEQLSEHCGFKPYYLRAAGGMVPVPAKGALLLITHAQREVSFEYDDYWSGDDLIYTGRGQDGDQKLETANLDVAENRRTLYVLEHVGTYRRRFMGIARCVNHWWSRGRDKAGTERQIVQFRLRFNEGSGARSPDPERAVVAQASMASYNRGSRPFDEAKMPKPPAPNQRLVDPSETVQQFEKASIEHHQLLVALKARLLRDGWSEIEEIPSAVDLWARRDGVRVIFEAKTISLEQELHQSRMALSQLLEYKFFYGVPEDLLCLVTNRAISQRRQRFLNALGICVIYHDGSGFQTCGELSIFVDSLSGQHLAEGVPLLR